jgi:hypothetical protein
MSQPDVRIAEVESHLDRLRTQMEVIAKQFEEAARIFLADWYLQQLEEMRQAHSETVTALRKDRIHSLKAEVNELVAQVPERIEKEFSQVKYWTPGRSSLMILPSKRKSNMWLTRRSRLMHLPRK